MSIESIRISSFMTRNVKTETEDQNIQAVCKTMNENNIGSLIIMTPPYDNNPKPVGIITERDVVRIIGQLYPSLQHAPIWELMSTSHHIVYQQLCQRCNADYAAK